MNPLNILRILAFLLFLAPISFVLIAQAFGATITFSGVASSPVFFGPIGLGLLALAASALLPNRLDQARQSSNNPSTQRPLDTTAALEQAHHYRWIVFWSTVLLNIILAQLLCSNSADVLALPAQLSYLSLYAVDFYLLLLFCALTTLVSKESENYVARLTRFSTLAICLLFMYLLIVLESDVAFWIGLALLTLSCIIYYQWKLENPLKVAVIVLLILSATITLGDPKLFGIPLFGFARPLLDMPLPRFVQDIRILFAFCLIITLTVVTIFKVIRLWPPASTRDSTQTSVEATNWPQLIMQYGSMANDWALQIRALTVEISKLLIEQFRASIRELFHLGEVTLEVIRYICVLTLLCFATYFTPLTGRILKSHLLEGDLVPQFVTLAQLSLIVGLAVPATWVLRVLVAWRIGDRTQFMRRYASLCLGLFLTWSLTGIIGWALHSFDAFGLQGFRLPLFTLLFLSTIVVVGAVGLVQRRSAHSPPGS